MLMVLGFPHDRRTMLAQRLKKGATDDYFGLAAAKVLR